MIFDLAIGREDQGCVACFNKPVYRGAFIALAVETTVIFDGE